MIQINVNAQRAIRNLDRYAERIKSIKDDVWFIGESAKNRLKIKFPDLNIFGKFHPSEISYFIIIETGQGKFKWIFCPKWHTYFKRSVGQTTGQEMRSNIPELNSTIKKETEKIFKELIKRINSKIKYLSY